jgi:colanic acid/amylovoran biosynthesis protein
MSSGVPTLSIAYSVKARGINLDLFGHERYVLDTRTLDAAALAAGLATLQAEEDAIRRLYAERLPEWRERAGRGGELLKQAFAGVTG